MKLSAEKIKATKECREQRLGHDAREGGPLSKLTGGLELLFTEAMGSCDREEGQNQYGNNNKTKYFE